MLDRPITQALFEVGSQMMPGGVNSPVRAFKALAMIPLIVERGEADLIWDVDGHRYIDFCGSWGALILGHSPPAVAARLLHQITQGTSFGIATRFENEFAARILEHFPSMDKLRFVSSGTEATMTAVRLARGFTGHSTIVKFDGHYHGHTDSLLIAAGSGVTDLPKATSKGIPEAFFKHTVSLPFNDLETCRHFLRMCDDLAGVMLEPVTGNMGVIAAKREFLEMLREETAKKGALLIIDEVITGYRLTLGGVQTLYGVDPDLTCLGKIIGGGLPAAAFGGKRAIMDCLAPMGPVYQAGTLSGNPLAMCAGLETILQLEAPQFYQNLAEKSEQFLAPIRREIAKRAIPAVLQSSGSMFTLFFGPKKVESRADLAHLDEDRFRQFFQYLFHRGIYLSPHAYEAHFISAAHTPEHLAYAQEVILDFLSI